MDARRARVVLVAVLVCAAVLVLADVRDAAPARALRGAAAVVLGPPVRALAWLRTEAGERLGGSADERARIAELEQQLAAARADAASVAAGELDEAATRALAARVPAEGYRGVPARLVAKAGETGLVGSLALSAGSDEGVSPGQAVVTGDGLLGLVDWVSPQVSTVRLATDASASLAVRVAESAQLGVYRGTGSAGTLTLLDPLGPMAAGDLVVTVGSADAVVPAEVPVGRITAISGSAADLSRAAEVTPAVDAGTADRILVLVPASVAP